MSVPSKELEAMIRAAMRAGESLKEAVSRPELLEVHEKGTSDYVSSADLRSQEIAKGDLAAAFPDHAFLLEEGDAILAANGAPRFIIDPLDGTTNFLHGMPHFSVSIAREVDGEIVSGVVADPMKNEIFWAEKGKGAWLGTRRLSVSKEKDFSHAVIGTGVPHKGRGDHPKYLEALRRVMADVAGIRRLGSAALDLAWVASARFDAFFETGLAAWDVAAGMLLVTEAGGIVTKTNGEREHLSGDVLAAANADFHRALKDRIESLHGSLHGASSPSASVSPSPSPRV